ncbi:MAG: hypothetical protein MK538_20915 [Planctomycetes bacterium]|nr:hypothetical protein [Planctomycetota bacterium]
MSTGFVRYRTVRTSSPLEGSFQTYSRNISACSRASGPLALTIRTFLFDLAWTINAAVEAHLMVDSGHHQPWLVDATMSILSGYLGEDELPKRFAEWRPIDMSRKPISFRGYDFGMEAHRAQARRHKVSLSTLQEEEDIRKVLQFPDLVLKKNWAAILEKTGIRTNEKYLEKLKKRVLERALTDSALEGVQELRASMEGIEGTANPTELTRTMGFAPQGDALTMAEQLAANDAAQDGVGGDAAMAEQLAANDAAQDAAQDAEEQTPEAMELSSHNAKRLQRNKRRRERRADGKNLPVRSYVRLTPTPDESEEAKARRRKDRRNALARLKRKKRKQG